MSQDTPDRITMVTQIAKKQPWNAIASCAFCDRKNHPACPTVYPRGPDSNAIGVNAAAYRAFHRSFSHERQSNDPKPNMNRKNRLKGELPRLLRTQAQGVTCTPATNSRLVSKSANQAGIRQRIADVLTRDVFPVGLARTLSSCFDCTMTKSFHLPKPERTDTRVIDLQNGEM